MPDADCLDYRLTEILSKAVENLVFPNFSKCVKKIALKFSKSVELLKFSVNVHNYWSNQELYTFTDFF